MKEKIQKIIPSSIYSFLVKLNKMLLTFYVTSGNNVKNKNITEKKILIVKPDAIGDYIMFRNFIKELKNKNKYDNYKLYLLGNSIWEEITNKFDKKYLEKTYFIKRKLLFNKEYIKNIISELNKENFELIIHPVFHREFIIDNIINKISANKKIGYSGKAFQQGKFELSISDKFYTKLIKTDKNLEFDKCKDFFEQILDKKINLKNPKINLKSKSKNYFVVNPGASVKFKQWKPEYFAKVIDHLIEKYKSEVYIVGSMSELELDKKVKNFSKNKNKINIFNGKSLNNLLKLIANSRGVVSNETGTTHIAIALNKKVYCIVSGVGYKTAYPYPNYKNAIYFYPPSFKKTMWNKELSDINETTPSIVIKNIKF